MTKPNGKNIKTIKDLSFPSKNSIFSSYNTITGHSIPNISPNACKEIIKNNPVSYYGYWLGNSDKGESVCFPLYPINNQFNPNINLDNFKNFEENKTWDKSYYFYDENTYPLWKNTYNLFYNDQFHIKQGDKYLSDDLTMTTDKTKAASLRFADIKYHINTQDTYPINNEDTIAIYERRTWRNLSVFGNKVDFFHFYNIEGNYETKFVIYNKEGIHKKEKKHTLNYSDKVYFGNTVNFLKVKNNKLIISENRNLDDDNFFELVPDHLVYHAPGKTVNLSQCHYNRKDGTTTYNGTLVTRNPNYYGIGQENYENGNKEGNDIEKTLKMTKGTTNKNPMHLGTIVSLIVIIIAIICIIIICLVVKRKK